MASCSKSCILSLRDCCKVWVWPAQAVSTSLIVTAHVTSASWIMALQWAFASLMASAALASFWHRAVSVLDTSLLQWESMETLVVSSCPMAMFIFLCSQSTSSDRMPGSALGWVPDHGVEGMLATVGVLGGDGEWLIGTVVGMSLGMAMCCNACEEVANGSGTDESPPMGWSTKAANGSSLLGVLCWETGIEVMGKVCCSLSKAPEYGGWGFQCY